MDVGRYRPNLLDPPGPITPATLQAGLERIGAGEFDQAWREFCQVYELITFIDQFLHNGPPDESGNLPPCPPAHEPLDGYLKEIDGLVAGLAFRFWSAFLPPEAKAEKV